MTTDPQVRRGAARQLARSAALAAVGAALGVATAVAELWLALLCLAALPLAPLLLWRPARAALPAALRPLVRALTRLELYRLARCYGIEIPGPHALPRSLGYLAARWPLGMLGALVLGVFPAGAYLVVSPLGALDGNSPAIVVFGLMFMYLSVQGTVGLIGMERWLARTVLGPTRQDLLEERVAELTASRAGVVEAVDEERRRIERDLHDGVQQRLVSLAMLLGRAQRGRDPDRAAALVRDAHQEARQALDELREVAFRVYPIVLDEFGLETALVSLADRAGLPLHVDYTLDRPPARSVATAVYFAVREAVTNAAKHAGADSVRVEVGEDRGVLTVRVTDNGRGGADPRGTGLSGLARRIAAVDGTLHLDSPPGGPTVLTARLPARPVSAAVRPAVGARVPAQAGADPAGGAP
ncbi:sensor histidine kinase [Streptomonospora nanhaiensis]|uniref:sensor histidine kinase n=1 Tax=Streptomonospora nanhaiensis TaxID=1323731 RepID=UPI001C38142A|nr:sensor histidine kinase [Streptomonospora nanhaiensis]MBV2361939.1 sensor histidine kinase [Streptomonospora nanhaiensis]MBX9390914.1 sensor histidine kinase [Streptomonospora nanhaiensis]